MPVLPQAIADLVAADGLARVATADDTSQHVLYWDTNIVRSMPASAWPPPLPTPPTARQSATAVAARQAAAQQALIDEAALDARVKNLAAGCVGMSVDDLLAGHVKTLIILWLHRMKALDKDGKIKQLSDWC